MKRCLINEILSSSKKTLYNCSMKFLQYIFIFHPIMQQNKNKTNNTIILKQRFPFIALLLILTTIFPIIFIVFAYLLMHFSSVSVCVRLLYFIHFENNNNITAEEETEKKIKNAKKSYKIKRISKRAYTISVCML